MGETLNIGGVDLTLNEKEDVWVSEDINWSQAKIPNGFNAWGNFMRVYRTDYELSRSIKEDTIVLDKSCCETTSEPSSLDLTDLTSSGTETVETDESSTGSTTSTPELQS